MRHLLVMIPSARGIRGSTVTCVHNMRDEVVKANCKMHLTTLDRLPLDMARNELLTAFLSTTADLALMIDDDVKIEPEWIVPMLHATAGDEPCDIISAPCRLRQPPHLFNIIPMTAPMVRAGLRVVECAWTGLGAVLITRRVAETLFERAEKYRSEVMPGRTSAAVFQSRVVPATRLFVEAPAADNVYLLDDRAFSMRAQEAGLKIHAAIDVPTEHDGLMGCFSAELENIERARAAAAGGGPKLIGADGRPLSNGASL